MSNFFNQKTIFQSKILLPFFHWIAKFSCFLLRWKVIGEKPTLKKYVVLFGTHTSNWDFIYMLIAVFYYKQPIFWIGKKALFESPLAFLFRWFGGLSLGELQNGSTVQQCVNYIKNCNECALALAPKGTRKAGAEWKTGFYHIAKEAEVPIACAAIDYKKRTSGVFAIYYLTDDFEKDISTLKSYYVTYENSS